MAEKLGLGELKYRQYSEGEDCRQNKREASVDIQSPSRQEGTDRRESEGPSDRKNSDPARHFQPVHVATDPRLKGGPKKSVTNGEEDRTKDVITQWPPYQERTSVQGQDRKSDFDRGFVAHPIRQSSTEQAVHDVKNGPRPQDQTDLGIHQPVMTLQDQGGGNGSQSSAGVDRQGDEEASWPGSEGQETEDPFAE